MGWEEGGEIICSKGPQVGHIREDTASVNGTTPISSDLCELCELFTVKASKAKETRDIGVKRR